VRVRTSPRWWPLGLSILTVVVSLGILATRWSAILASHPAYLLTLIVVATAATAIGVTSVLAPTKGGTVTGRPSAPRWRRLVIRGCGVAGVTLVLAVLLYLRPLPASSAAIGAMAGGPGVTVTNSATRIELHPTGAARTTGLVFYPGALVDPRAYVPNLAPLAEAAVQHRVLRPQRCQQHHGC